MYYTSYLFAEYPVETTEEQNKNKKTRGISADKINYCINMSSKCRTLTEVFGYNVNTIDQQQESIIRWAMWQWQQTNCVRERREGEGQTVPGTGQVMPGVSRKKKQRAVSSAKTYVYSPLLLLLLETLHLTLDFT